MRCTSARICGHPRQCWPGWQPSGSVLRWRIRLPPSSLRSSSVSPDGGSAGARSTPSLTRRRRGRARRISKEVAGIPGVVAVERLRARQSGGVLFVDLVVAVSRTLPLERVAAMKDRIVQKVREDSPAAEVTVTTEPRALDDETVLERVMVIARNRGVGVHHVTAHAIESRLALSLDLEVDGMLTLGAAHEIASGLEKAIGDELGPQVEVETHIEPMQPVGEDGRDARPARVLAVGKALNEIAAQVDLVGEIHDVRVREASGGEIVNFHCMMGAAVKVADAHEKVDEVERALRLRFPSIVRAIGHAEPSEP